MSAFFLTKTLEIRELAIRIRKAKSKLSSEEASQLVLLKDYLDMATREINAALKEYVEPSKEEASKENVSNPKSKLTHVKRNPKATREHDVVDALAEQKSEKKKVSKKPAKKLSDKKQSKKVKRDKEETIKDAWREKRQALKKEGNFPPKKKAGHFSAKDIMTFFSNGPRIPSYGRSNKMRSVI